MKITLIAEKSEQAQKYGKALGLKKDHSNWVGKYNGEDYVICALSGHVLQYKTPKEYDSNINAFGDLSYLPFFPVNLGKKVINEYAYKNVKYHLDNADLIVIGTDIDDEGELIAYEVINMSKNNSKPIKRLWINDTTPNSVRKGIDNLKDKSFSFGKYVQAETRSLSDYLVGMNLSPYYTKYYQSITDDTGLFTIGRVQVPTVWLIKNREDEIKNWNYREYRKIDLVVKKDGKEITFNSPVKYYVDEMSDEEFDKIMDSFNSTDLSSIAIDRVEHDIKEQDSPYLYSMPSIRSDANKKFKYEPGLTDKALQELHLSDSLTYPRTSVKYITMERYNQLKDIYEDLTKLIDYREPLIEPVHINRYVNDKESREHTALVPTDNFPDFEKLSPEARNIFFLSLKRTIMMFAGLYKYSQTKNHIHVNGIDFVNTQKQTMNLGWKNLEQSEEKDVVETVFEENEQINDFYIKVKLDTEKPPAHITETSLTKEGGDMAKYDLGTPATQTDIVKKIIDRGYVRVVSEKGKAKYLTMTPKGELLCMLTKGTVLGNLDWTNKWQQALEKVSQDINVSNMFIDNIKKYITKTVETPLNIDYSVAETFINKIREENKITECPICLQGTIQLSGKDRVACNNCDLTLYTKLCNKSLTNKQVKTIIEKGISDQKIKFKSKAGKNFENYVEFDKVNKRLTFPDFKKENAK